MNSIPTRLRHHPQQPLESRGCFVLGSSSSVARPSQEAGWGWTGGNRWHSHFGTFRRADMWRPYLRVIRKHCAQAWIVNAGGTTSSVKYQPRRVVAVFAVLWEYKNRSIDLQLTRRFTGQGFRCAPPPPVSFGARHEFHWSGKEVRQQQWSLAK